MEVWREAYRSEFRKLAKVAFPASTIVPELGASSNIVAFMTAIREIREIPAMKPDNSNYDLEEMCEVLDIKKECVKRTSIQDLYKHSSIKKANQNLGLLISFIVEGSQGEHLQVVSDLGCTGAIMDQAIPTEDSLPVALKGNKEETNVGGGGQICI